MEVHLIKFRVELVQADIFMLLGANSLDKAEEILLIYKVWILSVIGGTMNRVIFLLAAADTFLC